MRRLSPECFVMAPPHLFSRVRSPHASHLLPSSSFKPQVKFARQLQSECVPEWRSAYVDYKRLKKTLAAVRDGQEPDGSARSVGSDASRGGGGALSHAGSSDGSLRDLAGAVRGFLRGGGGGGAGSERPGSPTRRGGRGGLGGAGGAGARPRGAEGLITVRWSALEDGTPQSRVPTARTHTHTHARTHACMRLRTDLAHFASFSRALFPTRTLSQTTVAARTPFGDTPAFAEEVVFFGVLDAEVRKANNHFREFESKYRTRLDDIILALHRHRDAVEAARREAAASGGEDGLRRRKGGGGSGGQHGSAPQLSSLLHRGGASEACLLLESAEEGEAAAASVHGASAPTLGEAFRVEMPPQQQQQAQQQQRAGHRRGLSMDDVGAFIATHLHGRDAPGHGHNGEHGLHLSFGDYELTTAGADVAREGPACDEEAAAGERGGSGRARDAVSVGGGGDAPPPPPVTQRRLSGSHLPPHMHMPHLPHLPHLPHMPHLPHLSALPALLHMPHVGLSASARSTRDAKVLRKAMGECYRGIGCASHLTHTLCVYVLLMWRCADALCR
jgi:hypothetical protein